jgi:hypothetical protein
MIYAVSPFTVNYHDTLTRQEPIKVDADLLKNDDKWAISFEMDLNIFLSPARAIELRDAIDAAAAKVVRGVATASSAPVHDPSEEG